MAAANILATASTAASSGDIAVAAGTPLTVSLRGATGPSARVLIELKDEASAYTAIGELTSLQPSQSAVQITAPGTYRFTRIVGGTCGVFSG